jgi:hypothetical protein
LLTVGSPGAAGYSVQVPGPVGAGPGDAEAAGASKLWGRGTDQAGTAQGGTAQEREADDGAAIDLGRVVRERSAALVRADSQELAARACTELASLAGDLRRIGVDGDALVWAPRGERVPARALAELLRDGPDAGLSVLIGTTSPAAATELGGLAGTALIRRVADPDLAASLAARTGTRLLPRALAAALTGQRPDAGQRPDTYLPPDTYLRPAVPAPGDPVYPSAAVLPGGPTSAGTPAVAVAASAAVDLVPGPVIPARTLLTLGQAEFVLAVSWPRQRLVALGAMVPARLPRPVGDPAARPGTGT